MSLINQVLRDLETRKRREQQAPGEIRAVTSDARNLPRLFFILAGIVLFGVSLYLLWNNLERPTAHAIAKSLPAKTRVAAQNSANQTPAASVQPATAVATALPVVDATAAPAPVPANPASANPGSTQGGAPELDLLAATPLADHAGFSLRFNQAPAYHLFTLEHPDRIVLDVEHVTTANNFTTHAVMPAGVKTTRFSLEPGKRMRIVFEVNQGVTAHIAMKQDTTLFLQFTPPSAIASTLPASHAKSTSSLESATAKPGDMQKTLRNTPEDLARDAYNDGLSHLDAGDATGAEHRFRDALQQQPTFDPARIALARLLAQTGRNSDAEAVLAEGIKVGKDKPQFARLDANLLVQQGALADAMKVLESALPDIHTEPEHYAFMAALAQRSGDNARASKLYQEVLAVRPDNGVWWMGLGISLERLNQSQAALDAYRHAQQSGDLNPDVAQFVNQRIKALTP